MEPLLTIQNVSKHFVGIKALENINVQIYRNERVGLIGDNGAGKSTLIKIISGIYSPDGGEIYWEGNRVLIDSPATCCIFGPPRPTNWTSGLNSRSKRISAAPWLSALTSPATK